MHLTATRAIVAFVVMAAVFSAVASAQENSRVTMGLATWKTAGCADCHGKFADGNPDDDDFPTGADLRTTRLDPAAMRQTIMCGRPGMGMPSFDERAYVERSCYGQRPGSRPGNLQPTPRMLSEQEIDDVIAYFQERIIGRGRITRDECLAYHEGQDDACEDFKP